MVHGIKFRSKDFEDGPEVDHMLYFLSAAIQFYDRENGVWLEMCGKRHHEIYADIAKEGYAEDCKANHKEGFMYIVDDESSPRFIDRETATELAKASGLPMIGSVLTSEDLW